MQRRLHQDLEPGHVMITPGGQAVLTAFGMAATAGDPPATRTGTVPGRPGADGRLEVFARSTNGDLLHVWQLPGTATRWGGPGLLAGNGCSTDPAVLGGRNGEHGGHLEASGALAYATWTAQHGWSSWSLLPNSS